MSQLVPLHRLSSASLGWGRLFVLLLALAVAGVLPAITASGQEVKPPVEQIEAAAPGAHAEPHASGEHHGLSTDAPRIKVGPFSVTNSMIVTWIVAVGLIAFAQYATRQI